MSHHSVMSYRTLHIFFFSSLCEPGFLQLPPSARSLSVRVNVDSFFLHSYDRFNQKIGPCESSIWHPTILCGIRKAVQRTANLIKAARNNFLDLTCHCVMFKWLHSKKKMTRQYGSSHWGTVFAERCWLYLWCALSFL